MKFRNYELALILKYDPRRLRLRIVNNKIKKDVHNRSKRKILLKKDIQSFE